MRSTGGTSSVDARGGARDEIIEALKERIISGELRPGDRLRERIISEEFNVSRVPVREALFVLENQRLIRFEPRRGAFVTALTISDVHELFEIRAALEPLIGRLAAIRCRPDDIKALDNDLAEETRAAEIGDLRAGSIANAQFHQHLLIASHNQLLISLFSPLNLQIQRLFRRTIFGHEHEHSQEHRSIFNAIRDRQPDVAQNLLSQHVEATRGRSYEVADPDPTR